MGMAAIALPYDAVAINHHMWETQKMFQIRMRLILSAFGSKYHITNLTDKSRPWLKSCA